MKQHKHYISEEEVISMLGDNRGVTRYVQKNDVVKATKLHAGEAILHLFLDLPSKLEDIILFFPRTTRNSSYHDAASLEERSKENRLTRNTCNTSRAQITKQTQDKLRIKRSSRGSRKLKHEKEKTINKINATKLISKMKKKCGMK